MVKPLNSTRRIGMVLIGIYAALFTGPICQSEEYIFNLPLTRTVTQIEKGESTRFSVKPAPKGGPLFPSKKRILKIGKSYFEENIYEDGQVIKQEVILLGRTDEQVWFYLPEQPAPKLTIFSFLSKSVIITEVASFAKERGDLESKTDFTEAILEYGSFTFKN